MNPVLLCSECDEQSHQGDRGSHLRFDLPASSSTSLHRKESLHSNNSDSGTEEDSDVSYRL